MNLLSIVGVAQRLEIIMGDKNVLTHWRGAETNDLNVARSYLEEQELEDGLFPFQNGQIFLSDMAASACGVFQNTEQTAISIVSFFPKTTIEHALQNNFVDECAYVASRNATKLCAITFNDNKQIIWDSFKSFNDAHLDKAILVYKGAETSLIPGEYDIWGEELDVSHKWGLAAIRIRIVPKGQGIIVGEILS